MARLWFGSQGYRKHLGTGGKPNKAPKKPKGTPRRKPLLPFSALSQRAQQADRSARRRAGDYD